MIREKKILLIGNGFLAKRIAKFLNQKNITYNFCKFRGYFSIDELKYKIKKKYDIAIILFGKTSMLYCEKYKRDSYKVNVKKTIKVIEALNKQNIKSIYFSSDMVFSGEKKKYYPNTLQDSKFQYGIQKSIIENKYRKHANICILRLSKVIDSAPNFFIKKTNKKYLKKICAPILSKDVCLLVYKIIKNFKPGIYQFSSSPPVSNDAPFKKKGINKIFFPRMYNNIFNFYKKTSENSSSKDILRKLNYVKPNK